ncbi:MAG: DMT family transporter [Clostridia bacterium]|nr:DMT family transporter [Clostridia bacterium]
MKKGIFYTLVTALMFVTLEPISKLIAGDVSPYAITFWRFLIGALMLLPPAMMKVKKLGLKVTGKDILLFALLGVLLICVSMLSLQIAVKIADAPSLIAIIFSSNSIFTIAFACLLLKEKLTWNKVLALVFGVAGVAFCADFSSGTNLSSVALALLAALSFSLYTALSKKYTKKFSGLIQSGYAFFIGAIVLLIVLLIIGEDILPAFDVKSISIMLYLGIFITGIGYLAYFKAMEHGGTMMASLAFFIKPILTPFVTWLINGIVPNVMVFVAVACIVIASCFTMYKKKEAK